MQVFFKYNKIGCNGLHWVQWQCITISFQKGLRTKLVSISWHISLTANTLPWPIFSRVSWFTAACLSNKQVNFER